jgi:hypothetical protein
MLDTVSALCVAALISGLLFAAFSKVVTMGGQQPSDEPPGLRRGFYRSARVLHWLGFRMAAMAAFSLVGVGLVVLLR